MDRLNGRALAAAIRTEEQGDRPQFERLSEADALEVLKADLGDARLKSTRELIVSMGLLEVRPWDWLSRTFGDLRPAARFVAPVFQRFRGWLLPELAPFHQKCGRALGLDQLAAAFMVRRQGRRDDRPTD